MLLLKVFGFVMLLFFVWVACFELWTISRYGMDRIPPQDGKDKLDRFRIYVVTEDYKKALKEKRSEEKVAADEADVRSKP